MNIPLDASSAYSTKRTRPYDEDIDKLDELMANVTPETIKVTLYKTDPTEWMDDVLCAEFID